MMQQLITFVPIVACLMVTFAHADEPHPTDQYWGDVAPPLDFYDMKVAPLKGNPSVLEIIKLIGEIAGGCDHYWFEDETAYLLECALVSERAVLYYRWKLKKLPGKAVALLSGEAGDGTVWEKIPQQMVSTRLAQMAMVSEMAQ